MRRRFEIPFVIATLVLGLVLVFPDVFSRGYVQVPADILFADPVMRAAAPSGFTRPNNSLLGDLIYQFYVWHTIAARAVQATGKIPLWNPYLLAGQPLVANSQSALFYPINLLLYLFSPAYIATLRGFFNILVGGTFTFLFCRELRISFSGALLAGIAFAFSGAVMAGPSHAYASSLVWLPGIFWGAEKLINQSRRLFWSLVTSATVALSILGGHPETVFHNLLVALLYVIARVLFLNAPLARKAAITLFFFGAITLGLALGAIQWLPFAAFLSNSVLVSRSRSFTPESMFYTPEWLPNLATLATLVYPNFFGNPADATYFWPFSNFQNYLEQSMYLGLIPFALATGMLVTPSKRNTSALILCVLAIFCLAIALRLPGFEALNYLPIMDRANNTRLKWIFTFLAAVLAGFGSDALGQDVAPKPPRWNRFFWVSASIVLIALGIFGALRIWKGVLVATRVQVDPGVQQLLFDVFAISQPRTVATLAAAVIAAVSYVFGRRKPELFLLFPAFAILATFGELLVVNKGYNTTMPQSEILPPVRLINEIKKDNGLFRVLEVPPVFSPNYGAAYGISYVGGYDLPDLKNYGEVYQAQGGKTYRQFWSPEWPLVDWMNVKYVASANELKSSKYELLLSGDGFLLYRNKNVLPRAFIAHNWQTAPNAQAALEALTSGAFDFKNVVLLEQPLPPEQANAIRPAPALDLENVQFLSYSNDRVEMQANADAAGLVVMSDVIAPGWQVWVDDTPSQLLTANHAFRAVFIPAGSHRVRMEYHPIEFTFGASLSLIAVSIVVVGIPLTFCKSI